MEAELLACIRFEEMSLRAILREEDKGQGVPNRAFVDLPSSHDAIMTS